MRTSEYCETPSDSLASSHHLDVVDASLSGKVQLEGVCHMLLVY